MRLIHQPSGTALKFTGQQLPDWGHNQLEVTCDKVVQQDDTIWNAEEHRYTLGETAGRKGDWVAEERERGNGRRGGGEGVSGMGRERRMWGDWK